MKTIVAHWVKHNYPYLLTIVFFIFFKSLYPNPDLFLDSVNYLQWGFDHYMIIFRPLGYTHFLMFFDGWANNQLTIVVVQFLVFMVSSYYFLETLFTFFQPSQAIKWLCWIAVIFNPLSYFLINLVSPDCFFISISAAWLAALLRYIFIEKHRYVSLGIHLLCLVILFSLRYNAQYYPFFAIAIILLCQMTRTIKLIGVATNVAIFALIYTTTVDKAEEYMHVRIMSGFSGWVLANNAIHIYNVTTVDSNIFEETEQLSLHQLTLRTKDSAYNYKENPGPTDRYMWSPQGPLKLYLGNKLKSGIYGSYLDAWWGESVLYKDFAITLITHYPGAYIKAFYWPNFKEFFYPGAEALTSYNFYKQKLVPEWMEYLGLRGENVLTSPYSNLQKDTISAVIMVYAVLSPLCMLFCFIVVLFYLAQVVRTRFKVADSGLTIAFILSSFYLVSTFLLVFAHPVLLRYISMLLIFFNILPFIAYKSLRNRMPGKS